MVAYRFCRTDDMPLLVDAHNACLLPSFPGQQPLTLDGFKRWIRELDLWCSSCMVASEGDQLIGVLIGNKRDEQTLIHEIAVHPDWQRQGHAAHMLTSLSQKLAILGPPRLVAEIPESLDHVAKFFESEGFAREETFVDFAFAAENANADASFAPLVGSIGVEDLVESKLMPPLEPTCAWERDQRSLINRKRELVGWAVASDAQVEAFVLATPEEHGEQRILRLGHAEGELGPPMLDMLMRHVCASSESRMILSKLIEREAQNLPLERWGFAEDRRYACYTAEATSRHE